MWYIEMGGVYTINNNKVFGRKIYCDIKEKTNIRKKFNNTDVYATVFQYNNEDQNKSDLIGPMYIDLDMNIQSEDDFTKLKDDLKRIVTYLNLQYNIPTDYINFFFTGKKGFHLLIPSIVFGIKPDKNLNVYYKEIAKELNDITMFDIIDLKIYDKKRLFRLPNSINGKTGLYKVPISYQNILKFNYEEIKDYAKDTKPMEQKELPKPVDKAIKKIQAIKDNLNKKKDITKHFNIPTNVDISKVTFPKCIKKIFNEGCSEGDRNNTTIILSSALFQKGIDYDTTLNIVKDWNEEKNSPSLTETEIINTVTSAYNMIQSGRRYGCASIRDMGLCIGRACNIYR